MKNNVIADEFRDEGNSFFRQVKFYEALISYNKSLCHAMPKSTQLALAYANRSTVYLELKLFNKCLYNIQLARGNKYPNEEKLKKREKKCKEEQLKAPNRDMKNDPWTYFKLSFPSNKKIPFIVDCLEVKTDEKYGRHIVTNRVLNPGDVTAIEPPIFHTLDKSAWYSKCTFCLKSNMLNLIPCNFENSSSVCTSAMYCNQDCMTNARDRFHGVFCIGFEKLLGGDDEHTNIASTEVWKRLLESLYIAQSPQVLQSLMTSNKHSTIFDFDLSEQVDDPDTDFKYLSIFNNLEADSDKNSESIFREISSEFVQICPKFIKIRSQSPELVSILVEYSARLGMINRRNAVGLLCRSQWVGTAIAPFGSLYNHACDNNIGIILIDNRFVHIVMKPIKSGEQVFMNYGFFYDARDRIERQKSILKKYGFTCTCAACLNDWSVTSFARFDPKFVQPSEELPDTIQGTMTELKKHYKYIKNNLKNHPSYELHHSILKCDFLLRSIEEKSSWPF